jgi:hypothetical protein
MYRFAASKKVLMISHMPMDFHIMRFFAVDLIESFTGNVKTMSRESMGKKVFKHDIPFTPATHALLGDNYLIRCSLDRKKKKELIEFANGKWEHTPALTIEREIREELKIKVPFKVFM